MMKVCLFDGRGQIIALEVLSYAQYALHICFTLFTLWQAQHPGLPLMFSPKSLVRIPDQVGQQ